MTFVAFREANDIADRFLALLSKLDIDPPSGSELEDELLSLAQLIEVAKNPSLAKGTNAIAVIRAAVGLHDLAAKVLSVECLPEFATFVPHLRLIAKEGVYPASIIRIAPSRSSYDDTARKMAELYMGCLAAHVGTEIELDSPTNAQGDNPDVIFKVEPCHPNNPPQHWALAIKTISSQVGQTIFDRIKEGAKQIDDEKCTAERGMVVINAKNALDHDTLWRSDYPDLQSAIDELYTQLKHLSDSAADDRLQTEWDDLFKGKVARPVLFLGQSVVRLPTPAGGEQTPTALKMLLAYHAEGEPDPVAADLAEVMNDFMQTILHGHPGGPGYLPC